jgi:hypothetical protein
MKFLSTFASSSDTYEKNDIYLNLRFVVNKFWFHFNQSIQVILNSQKINLKILFAIDDRKIKK